MNMRASLLFALLATAVVAQQPAPHDAARPAEPPVAAAGAAGADGEAAPPGELRVADDESGEAEQPAPVRDADSDVEPPPVQPAAGGACDAPRAGGTSRRRASALTPRGVHRRTAGFYAGCTAVLMPLWEPRHVQSLVSTLRLPPPVGAALMAGASGVYHARQRHMLPCLLAHEVITDVSADITAQAFEAGAPRSPFELDWRRVLRSTSVSLISDDFPFLLWSRALWVVTERLAHRLRASRSLSPRLVAFLTNRLTVSVGKMIVTQVVYESASNALYLALQAAFRGMGWNGVLTELRHKFFKCWCDGVLFWSAAHVVVFAMPFWWLQPIVDNTFTLFFNTYLAMLAHSTRH
ncbi:hypothetical protein KFE25_013898 [Diacronema lutheri]|uniref:Uncharacterized protein n=1 Tax=Diacronema lutheri TaxID=2081491 RepID=A0A8J5XCP2_DIALT|nr:hypothetical protein KFE25_013898 [Diacronema lutheri]